MAENNLTFLTMPPEWERFKGAWSDLKKNLLEELRRRVKSPAEPQTFEVMRSRLKEWKWYCDDEDLTEAERTELRDEIAREIPGFSHQHEVAQKALELARNAAMEELSQKAEAIVDRLDRARWSGLSARDWDLFCWLRGKPVESVIGTRRTLAVPLEQRPNEGLLAVLEVEVLQEGRGEIYADPIANTFTYFDHDFVESAEKALEWAKAGCQRQGGVDPRLEEIDLRYRLKWVELRGVSRRGDAVDGSSAEAAFYLCAVCSLKAYLGQEAPLLDSSVAVTASLVKQDGELRLSPVGALSAKVEAAYGKGVRLVLVAQESESEAQNALQGARLRVLKDNPNYEAATNVVGCETAKDALEHASGLVVELIGHLKQLSQEMDTTPWFRQGQQIRISEIAVDAWVRTEERRTPLPLKREDQRPLMESRSFMEEIDAERYERLSGEFEEQLWRRFIQRGQSKLVLKGAPGSGKSFLTKHTVVTWSQECLEKLENQQTGVEELSFPFWITARNLAQSAGKDIQNALTEALLQTVSRPAAEVTYAFLRRAAGAPSALIFVDALDELQSDDQKTFQIQARRLGKLPGRVVVTCRTLQWEERKSWLGWTSWTEIELALFKFQSQREFVRKFFHQSREQSQDFEKTLQANFSLRDACTTPLLLTFACLLYEEKGNTVLNQGTKPADLHTEVVRNVFAGRWRNQEPPWARHRTGQGQCSLFLRDTAWNLFCADPGPNRFTLSSWQKAAQEAGPITVLNLDGIRFLDELEKVGMVVPAGYEVLEPCWSFLHRTFLEFLVAWALRDKNDWLDKAREHFWFDANWRQVLRFLAGLLPDATPLIKAVEEEQKHDDLFRSMLQLKAELIGAAKYVDPEVVERATEEALTFWRETVG